MELIIYFIIMIIFGITSFLLLITILGLIVSIYLHHLTGIWDEYVIVENHKIVGKKSVGFLEDFNENDNLFNTMLRILVFIFTGSYLFGWF